MSEIVSPAKAESRGSTRHRSLRSQHRRYGEGERRRRNRREQNRRRDCGEGGKRGAAMRRG